MNVKETLTIWGAHEGVLSCKSTTIGFNYVLGPNFVEPLKHKQMLSTTKLCQKNKVTSKTNILHAICHWYPAHL